ncbi:MAG: TOBE domain-containing protein, partial [Lentisphaerae bacterium]|nr:TOBE domain-containing protein [Lentisphaerota bacterium]
PRVFLMDEPLSNLDAQLRAQTRAMLIKLHRRLRVTTVYVTHDQVEAMTMGERVAVFNRGELHQVDTPRNIYDSPANRFVGEFIGSPGMNFLRLAVRQSGEGVSLVVGKRLVDVPRKFAETLKALSEVHLGVRPEAVRLQQEEGFALGGVPAGVELVEPLGGEYLVHLRIEGMRLVARLSLQRHIPSDGDTVPVYVDADRLCFFHVESGARLPAEG